MLMPLCLKVEKVLNFRVKRVDKNVNINISNILFCSGYIVMVPTASNFLIRL